MLTLGNVAEELKMWDPTVPVVIINVEENPEIAKQFGIYALPSLFVMS
jgi:thioredoxin-like negative regulator of GroEL